MQKHKYAHTYDTSTVLKDENSFILSSYLFLRLQRPEDEGAAKM